MRLREGAKVLDVCCGTGASAIPAAHAVGSTGLVIGIDLAEELLKIGREKAGKAGLRRLSFQRGDMTSLEFPTADFDAVVCVFGIFFVPQMEQQVNTLWRLVRPGGQLAITTWGRDLFAPAHEVWLEAVRRVRPELDTAVKPWDRITTPEAVRKLFADAGVPDVEVTAEDGFQELRTPADFWTVAMGSGLRWAIEQMDAGTAAAVREEVVAKLTAARVDRISTNVIYAVARKPT